MGSKRKNKGDGFLCQAYEAPLSRNGSDVGVGRCIYHLVPAQLIEQFAGSSCQLLVILQQLVANQSWPIVF